MSKWTNFGINPSKNILIEHKRDYKGDPEKSHSWEVVDAEYYNIDIVPEAELENIIRQYFSIF